MLYLIFAIIWPLAFVGLYFAHPLLSPDAEPLNTSIFIVTALLGVAAFTFAGALRLLGFLRDDLVKREKFRDGSRSNTSE